MKVAMRRPVLAAIVCFAVALVVSAAFIVWLNADLESNIVVVLSSLQLSYLYVISSGLAAFSAGALVALAAASLAHLRMPSLPRAAFAALGWLALGLLLLAPVAATMFTSSFATAFVLVIYGAVKAPVLFAAFGLLLGLGFAERRDDDGPASKA